MFAPLSQRKTIPTRRNWAAANDCYAGALNAVSVTTQKAHDKTPIGCSPAELKFDRDG
jgi:hypothetical protein